MNDFLTFNYELPTIDYKLNKNIIKTTKYLIKI